MQEMSYQIALIKHSESDFSTAIDWYENAGDYSDAKEQILSIGEYYYITQQYEAAEAVFVRIPSVGNAAQRLYELGEHYERENDIDHAIICYREAGEYEDAANKVMEFNYQAAESLFLSGDWAGAKLIYEEISDYKEAASRIIDCDNYITTIQTKYKQIGNLVTFGHYEQDNNLNNGKEDIEWLILDVQENKVLLISRYGLDVQPYNTNNTNCRWDKCSLRTWLNDTFLNSAFTEKEQGIIITTLVDNSKDQGYSNYQSYNCIDTQDKIFLLSYAEAKKYFNVRHNSVSGEENFKSRVHPTKYAIQNGAQKTTTLDENGNTSGKWWLRSPGNFTNSVAMITDTGSLYSVNGASTSTCIRPVLWINLDSIDIFKFIKAVPTSEQPQVSATPAPTATPMPTATPKPTTTPKPTATPMPQSYETLKKGDSGDDVLKLQQALINLGYLDGPADGVFGSKTETAVILFKDQNYEDSYIHNGTADNKFQIYLFDKSPKKYQDPEMVLVMDLGGWAEWESVSNDRLKIHFEVHNIGRQKVIKSFELYLYAVNSKGEKIYGETIYNWTTTKKVNPGSIVYSDYVTISKRSKIDKIFCGIHKVKYDDGTTYTVKDIDYFYWQYKK